MSTTGDASAVAPIALGAKDLSRKDRLMLNSFDGETATRVDTALTTFDTMNPPQLYQVQLELSAQMAAARKREMEQEAISDSFPRLTEAFRAAQAKTLSLPEPWVAFREQTYISEGLDTWAGGMQSTINRAVAIDSGAKTRAQVVEELMAA